MKLLLEVSDIFRMIGNNPGTIGIILIIIVIFGFAIVVRNDIISKKH